MPTTTPNSVSILPSTQQSGGSLKEKAFSLSRNAQASKDAALWSVAAEALVNAQSQIDTIMGALRSPLPVPQVFQITSPSGALIAEIGNLTGANNQAYLGIWANNLYVGGAGPDTAKLVALADGSVSINGATFVLTSGGVVTTISNAPGTVGPWTGQVTSLISKDVSTGCFAEIDPFHIALADSGGNPVAWLSATSSGHGLLTMGKDPSTGQLITIDGSTTTMSLFGGGVAAHELDITPTQLEFFQAVGGNDTIYGQGGMSIVNGANSTSVSIAGFSTTALAIFANNAAAITGGLVAGNFYRTGANPDPVCVVH